jgi:hypothetical protein
MGTQNPGVAAASSANVEGVAGGRETAELLGKDAATFLIPPIPVLNFSESYQFGCFHDASFYHVLCWGCVALKALRNVSRT